mgnify:CR=1 FL=1
MGKRGPKPKKKPMGAPSKLTHELIEQLANVLRRGAYVETAVAHCGISKASYYSWARKGADERKHIMDGGKPRKTFGLYLDLLDTVERAMADAELSDLRVITQAASEAGSWQAAAWKLERRNPSRWGRVRHEVTGKDGGPIEVKTWAALVASAAEQDDD